MINTNKNNNINTKLYVQKVLETLDVVRVAINSFEEVGFENMSTAKYSTAKVQKMLSKHNKLGKITTKLNFLAGEINELEKIESSEEYAKKLEFINVIFNDIKASMLKIMNKRKDEKAFRKISIQYAEAWLNA